MAFGNQSGLERSGETKLASPQVSPTLLNGFEDLISKLYVDSKASQFGMSPQNFTALLNEVLNKYCPNCSDSKQCRELLSSLKVSELVLARACAAGNELAWETLLNRYRQSLYEMGYLIAKNESVGKELADSLYADLYGISARGEQCPSKLSYYTGIGSLAGWMRTVMVQNFIDRCRREQRLTSLDEDESEQRPVVPDLVQNPMEGPTVPDPRLTEVVDSVLIVMDGEDRFLLASYYLDHQNLSDLAAILHVHESTISRRLDKITAKLRKSIRLGLLKRGMKTAEVDEALRVDVRDLDVDLTKRLKESTQRTDSGSFFKQRAMSKQSDKQ